MFTQSFCAYLTLKVSEKFGKATFDGLRIDRNRKTITIHVQLKDWITFVRCIGTVSIKFTKCSK